MVAYLGVLPCCPDTRQHRRLRPGMALFGMESAPDPQRRFIADLVAGRGLLSACLRTRSASRLGREARNDVLLSEFARRDRNGVLCAFGADDPHFGFAEDDS